MEREFELVKLKDGREVKVTELTGLDDMIAAKVIGKEMSTPGAGQLQLRYVMLVFAIKEINGKEVKRPVSLNDVRTFMAGFTSKQIGQIGMAYSRLNDYKEDTKGDTEEKTDEQGEASAAELMT
jgi:hypothetical protein